MTEKLSQHSDLELIEALEERDYFVVYKDDKLGHVEANELEEELYNRKGEWIVEKDDHEKMKEVLEEQGYKIYERDPQKELLEEMYYEMLCGPYAHFVQYMNGLFMQKLEKWI